MEVVNRIILLKNNNKYTYLVDNLLYYIVGKYKNKFRKCDESCH